MVLDSSINNITCISWQTIFYSGGGVVGFWRLTPVSTIFQLYHGKLYFTGGKAMVFKASFNNISVTSMSWRTILYWIYLCTPLVYSV